MKARNLIVVALVFALGGCMSLGTVNPAVGNWSVQIQTPGPGTATTWAINEDMSGMLTLPEGAPLSMNNTMCVDGALTFDVVFDMQGTELPAKFVGTITGDEVDGAFQTSFGNVTAKGMRQ